MNALEMTLLFDYYGDLLTERQKMCFDLRHNQDLSLGEIAEVLQVSRQGVHDNLSRAETLLQNMEEKTGCVRRAMELRKAASSRMSESLGMIIMLACGSRAAMRPIPSATAGAVSRRAGSATIFCAGISGTWRRTSASCR